MSRILDFQLTLGLCLLYVVAVFCTSNSFDSCYRGDQDCPPCPDTSHNLNFTSILFLSIFPQMINAAKQAQLLINQTDSQNVISLERLFGLHTSLNYFCCHSQSEKETIVQVLRKFQWTPKILTYDVFGCNLDHDGVTIYLHAQPNSVGQRTLFTMIREIEQAIENAGVPLINKRHQSFHCTLARVNHNYPVDDIVKKINGTIDFGTVTFNWFILDGHIFYATNNKTIT